MLTKPLALSLAVAAVGLVSSTGHAAAYTNFALPSKSRPIPVVTSYTTRKFSIKSGNSRLTSPSVNKNTFLFAREAFLAERRDQAIKLLRQDLDSNQRQNEENILLRLGQLYAEKYMELSYLEGEVYSEQLEQFEKVKAKDPKAKAPKQDSGRSQTYLRDSLNIFYSLERKYPRHPKIDEILFFIGFVETENGHGAKGVQYLERVVRNYPRSRKFEDATLYLADHYFDKQQYPYAAGKYRIILSRSNSDVMDYARYKLAWCDLNTGQGRRGLQEMKSLVKSLEGTQDKAKFNLREQAIKDLAVFFVEAEAVEEAFAWYDDRLGKEKAYEYLKLIADMLRSKARDHAAIKAYSRLVEDYPEAKDTPLMYMGIYDCQQRLGRTNQAVDTLVTVLSRYGASSSWAKSFPRDKEQELKAILNQLQADAEKSALQIHQSAQKSQNKEAYDQALRIYEALLEAFPNHPSKKNIAYYKGDILFLREKWLEAATSYLEAAKVPPKDKLTDEAVYAALQSLDNLTVKSETITRYTKEQQKTLDTNPEEIPAGEKRFIEVAQYYVKEYPQGNRVVDVRFRIAALHYRHRHFDVALVEFLAIATQHPKHRAAPTAAHIVLDIYNIRKDYDSLNTAAAKFANTEGLGDAKFKAEMAQIVSEVGFKRIESIEKNNQWEKAGDAYLAVYNGNPSGPLAEKALYNAYISYEKSDDVGKAKETSRMFVAMFPNSEYTQRLALGLAKAAERQYDFESAQRLYQNYARKYPKDKESRKALYNAAVFAELSERDGEAMTLYNEYLRGPHTIDEEKGIQASQGRIYRRTGDVPKMTLTFRRLSRDAKSVDEKLAYLGELAKNYEQLGKEAEKDQTLKEMRAIYNQNKGAKVTGPGVAYLAEAEFHSADRLKEKYYETQLRFPPNDLVYLLQVKQKRLIALGEAYDKVVEVGVPEWGVAALYEKSEAYDNFVRGFRSLKIPAQYKGDGKKEIETALKGIDDRLVKPLETKSQEFAQACSERAAQFYVANAYAARCRERAKKVDSGAVIEPSGILPQPRYWSTRPPGLEVAAE